MAQPVTPRMLPQVNCGLVGVGTVGSAVLDFFADGPLSLPLSGAMRHPAIVPIHVWSASRRSRTNPRAAPEQQIRRVLKRAGGDGDRFQFDIDSQKPSSRFSPGRPAWRDIVSDPKVDIVVELTGSAAAETIIEEALWQGKCVVTANKKVMSRSGYELVKLAQARGAVLAYEAAVGGGMPIVQTIGASIGGRVESLLTIINGTCNFMLSMMAEAASSGHEDVYAPALTAAMDAGLAEADPSDDVLGEDARSKLTILTGLALGVRLRPSDIYVRGIARRDRMTREAIFTATDLRVLDTLSLRPKLLAGTQRILGSERVAAWVSPAVVPTDHPLAGVDGAGNACLMSVESPAAAGEGHSYEIMLRGPGAGGPETASSVIADIRFCANQLAVAGRLGNPLVTSETPRAVYMYGAGAFGHTQPYKGSPTVYAEDGLVTPFLIRFHNSAESSQDDTSKFASGLSQAGVGATAVTPTVAAAGHHYVRTEPTSFQSMERALETMIAHYDASRMSLDILYVPIIEGVALGGSGKVIRDE